MDAPTPRPPSVDRLAQELAPTPRPPSVDRLARALAAAEGLPHSIAVALVRGGIAEGAFGADELGARAKAWRAGLPTPVINATGVLLHTNLGRAPLAVSTDGRPTNLELDLRSGQRGSRQAGIGALLAALTGAQSAMVVNNNAAAVLLATAALGAGREVAVSRGESVEIGGEFRIPEVIEQSGARLVDVGTTNRTRAADYRRAITRRGADVAMILKVHPSNYRVEGFTASPAVAELAEVAAEAGLPLVVDIGSGLIDANCPWLAGPPPAWLDGEPAVRQTLAAGEALVTFSGDKLFGGPQAGILAGRSELIERCARHPLARALRPGSLVLAALAAVATSYLTHHAGTEVTWWRQATTAVDELRARAAAIAARVGGGDVIDNAAVPGAGAAPGRTIPSVALRFPGDHLAALRAAQPVPVIARVADGATLLDLRSVEPADDDLLAATLATVLSGAVGRPVDGGDHG